MRMVKTPYPRVELMGSVIAARTADEDGRNLRGHAADRVIVDEAAYVNAAVVDDVVGPMLADVDGDLVLISSPRGKNHFYRAWLGADVRMQCPTLDNPYVSHDYVVRQRGQMSHAKYAQEYEAVFGENERGVFGDVDVERALEVDFGGDEIGGAGCWQPRIAGVDWARYVDYTAVAVCAGSEDRLACLSVERFQGSRWSEAVARVVDICRRSRVTSVVMDETGIGSPLKEEFLTALWSAGESLPVEGIVFTNANKEEMVERLAGHFEHGRIDIPDDEDLVRELRVHEAVRSKSGAVIYGGAMGEHDDKVTALMLGAHGVATCESGSAQATGQRAKAPW